PKVIEFNARFGDPEAMNVLPLLIPDFSAIVCRITDGTLAPSHVSFAPLATVCKYLVPEGYPEAPVTDAPIEIGNTGRAQLFYANVGERDGRLYTQRSRTLAFVGAGETLAEAESIAESAAREVRGPVRHRRDIGTAEVLERRIAHMRELR
ncbi:MAG: phosphoribosylglycinamide synthetase C domain-containing protein, partial [Methanomicrobiaceae archaeon]|nr:phosphoribosylglycinamide synthetase C domain-containing protein [Methanomicrobiaceae archaeon]